MRIAHAHNALRRSLDAQGTPRHVISPQGELMSARSIRRALERQQTKLARKAEKAALQNRDCEGASAVASSCEPNPELLDEFTPEFIAEANALRERVHGRIALPKAADSAALDSDPRVSERRPAGSGRVSSAQLAANRQNSQLSCGPRSSA